MSRMLFPSGECGVYYQQPQLSLLHQSFLWKKVKTIETIGKLRHKPQQSQTKPAHRQLAGLQNETHSPQRQPSAPALPLPSPALGWPLLRAGRRLRVMEGAVVMDTASRHCSCSPTGALRASDTSAVISTGRGIHLQPELAPLGLTELWSHQCLQHQQLPGPAGGTSHPFCPGFTLSLCPSQLHSTSLSLGAVFPSKQVAPAVERDVEGLQAKLS